MIRKTGSERLNEAILETAEGMNRLGIMDDETYEKITLRHAGLKTAHNAVPISGDEIRALREKAHLSQAVFSRFLNLTPGYVSQLERGVKKPTGPALVILNVIRRKGIEVML
jgi:putative transcriptional regulator